MAGWLGNILLVFGYILAGRKHSSCWFFIFFGCLFWFIHGFYLQMWDIMTIKIICASIALRNIYLWRKNSEDY